MLSKTHRQVKDVGSIEILAFWLFGGDRTKLRQKIISFSLAKFYSCLNLFHASTLSFIEMFYYKAIITRSPEIESAAITSSRPESITKTMLLLSSAISPGVPKSVPPPTLGLDNTVLLRVECV